MKPGTPCSLLAPALLALAALPGNLAARPVPSFEPNRGQAPSEVRFLARGRDLDLAITADGALLRLRSEDCHEVVRMRVAGASGQAVAEGLEPLPWHSNYLRGADPSCWTAGVPHFARVRSRGLRPGVDLVWHTTVGGDFEHDFMLAAGVDPDRLEIRFEGTRTLRIDEQGGLVIESLSGAELRARAPIAWQEAGHGIQPVAVRWITLASDRAGFVAGDHDRSQPLVIDPVLAYSSYLGGSYDDEPQRVAIDAAGNIYLVGYTDSPDFPTASPLAAFADLTDAFVTKLDASTGAPIFSTYLGGTGDDAIYGLAIDDGGSAVVVGETDSADFPLVAAEQPVYGGAGDAFVARLDPTGSALVYSSYLGGSEHDTAYSAARDGLGAVLVAGRTASSDFPVRAAYQPAFGGGFYDAFLARFDPAAAALTFATYLGGSDDDEAFDVVADAAGRAHLTGDTFSPDFPLRNALQPTHVAPAADAFVSRFSAAGDALELSTYLGGSEDDWGSGIALDAQGAILVGGTTYSSDFPTRGPLFGPASGERGFVSKLLADGSDFVYSTFFGGSGGETAVAFAGDGSGAAYLAGLTSSADLPVVFGVQPFHGGGVSDGFVARLDPSGAALSCSSYFGGSGQDGVIHVAAIDETHFVVTGWSDSSDLPTVNPYQPAFAGGAADGFVARVGCNSAPADVGNTLWLTMDPGYTHAVVAWTDATEGASYRLYGETDKSLPFVNPVALGASGASGIRLPLAPPPLLFYRLSAGNCCGEGPR